MEKNNKKSIIVENCYPRLDLFLSDYFSKNSVENNFSRSKIKSMIDDGAILLNSMKTKASGAVKIGDIVDIIDDNTSNAILPQNIPIDILYEDEFLIVLNKPKNMLTHPTSHNSSNTLVNALLYHCKDNLSDVGGAFRRGIVHRLDKNTSGLMLVAKTNEAHNFLSTQIKNKTAIRRYMAIVYGVIEEDEGTIDKPLSHVLKSTVKMRTVECGTPNSVSAITHFKVLKRFQNATLLSLQLETGRTHQIRAHLNSVNHPIVGDTLYGSRGFKNDLIDKIKTNEQILVSYYLSFTHFKNNEIMKFELPPDKFGSDFIKILNVLERSSNG